MDLNLPGSQRPAPEAGDPPPGAPGGADARAAPGAPLPRLHFLDSLRGIAALYVILYHSWIASAAPVALDPWLRGFVAFGGTGVFLFFVVSGFSLAMTMPRHLATGRPLTSYAISRFFRIAPLFYAVLLYMVACAIAGGQGLRPRTVAANVTFLFNLFPGKQDGIVMASWTIGVEMLFYAAFPLIQALKFRAQALLLIASQLLFVAMVRSLPPTYNLYTIVGCLPLFMLGMWSHALLVRVRRTGRAGRAAGAALIAGGCGLLVLCAVLQTDPRFDFFVFRNVVALGCALLIVGLGLQAPGTLSSKVLRLFGRISYSTYLLHELVIAGVDRPLIAFTAGMPGEPAYAIRAATVLALVVPAALVANRLVERPAERLGRALTGRLAARREAPLALSPA